jgi:hypothetical protein
MGILVITWPVTLVRGLRFGIGNVVTMAGTTRPVHRTDIPVLFPTQRDDMCTGLRIL